jgi:hypothetical protein
VVGNAANSPVTKRCAPTVNVTAIANTQQDTVVTPFRGHYQLPAASNKTRPNKPLPPVPPAASAPVATLSSEACSEKPFNEQDATKY